MNTLQYTTCDIAGLEALSCRGNRVFSEHIHSGHVLWLNCSGGERFSVQGRSNILQHGYLSIIDAGVVHANHPVAQGPRDLRSLYLEETFWQALAVRLELPSLHPPRLCTQEVYDPYLWHDVAEWHAALFAGEDTLAIEQRMLKVFSQLLKRVDRVHSHQSAMKGNLRLQRMLEFLHACFVDKISLAHLSDIGQCSQMHVLRLFKDGLGISPHSYLVQLRLEQARSQLRVGTPIVDAALEAGFSDQSHLQRAFRRRYGLTPAQYRRQCLWATGEKEG